MGRKPKALAARRVQVRLSDRHAVIFDGYSADDLSAIMAIALDTIRPDSEVTKVPSTILRPSIVNTESIARIVLRSNRVEIHLPEKDEDFRLLAKRLKYQWDSGCWHRSHDAAVICDRAAEIAYRTMELGISVQLDCLEVRQKVISGKFQIEPMRTIKIFEGWLAFYYPRDDDYYSRLLRLSAAQYSDGAVRVPIEHFAEVEDFAECEGFEFSETARKAVEDFKKKIANAEILEIAPLKSRKNTKKKARKKNESVAEAIVPDHLKDDDA